MRSSDARSRLTLAIATAAAAAHSLSLETKAAGGRIDDTDAGLDRAARVSEADKDRAVRSWRDNAPGKWSGLIEADGDRGQ